MDIVNELRGTAYDKDNMPRMKSERSCSVRLALAAADKIERLREALHQWDALIEYTYNGSREAMSAMTDAAHNTAQILYGDPPWPDPKARAALKGDE